MRGVSVCCPLKVVGDYASGERSVRKMVVINVNMNEYF